MTKVLVTGANGFIGSHLVRALLDRGYEVNCLVRDTSDVRSLHELAIRLFLGDVREPATLVEPVKGVDYIYHLAARLMVTSQAEFEETNTAGTKNMLEAADKYAKDTLKRFLLASSQAAAGPGKDPTPLDESVELKPISWYGMSKKLAEDAVRSYSDRLPATIVRPSSVYGEREQDISQAFPTIENHIQPVLGLETKYVVMVYVGDLVKAFIAAAESPNSINQSYFLCHPEVLTPADVVKTTAKAMGKPNGLVIPVPGFFLTLAGPLGELIYQFTRNRPPMTRDKAHEISQRYWVMTPAKAKHDFGWEAEHNLLQGMQPTTKYFMDEEKNLRDMPLEQPRLLLVKYVITAIVVGALIEIISSIGMFYSFSPWWLVFIVVLGGFGLILGTVSMLVRKQSTMVQFLIGALVLGAAEVFNMLNLFLFGKWVFAPGWPFGITNEWVRTVVLAIPGGIFIILVNYLMQQLYQRRLKLG